MRINKSILMFFTSILLAKLSFGQMQEVRFEQLDSVQKIEKRPVVVFLYTSWCKYCGTMKNTTFKNDKVVNLLNKDYYFISLDFEEKRDIPFRGYTFRHKPTGTGTGVHELAEQLGTINGQIAYPSICFLNSEYEIIYHKEGFVAVNDFLSILTKLKKP